jgi:hypothetical protein
MEPNNNKLQRINIVFQQNQKNIGWTRVNACYGVHKKLSQFDSF